jgi:hypothetical protein
MDQLPPEPMEPHPDFVECVIPQEVVLGDFRLSMLTAADLDEDMAAIEESAVALDNIFGNGWPRGLTREKDLADLERHHREFIDRRAYAWVINDESGGYIGCAYLRPDMDQRGVAKAVHWMRSSAAGRGPAFAALFHDWLRGPDWPTMDLKIVSRP